MFYSRSSALRCVTEFYHDVPLAFVAANPQTRQTTEQCKNGSHVAGNTLRSTTIRANAPPYEQIACTIEDPLGIVLARWWLRKRSVPELLTTDDGLAPAREDTPADPARMAEGKTVLLKNCRLYLRCLGGAGVQASRYVLSLGELMTFGVVERIDMSYFRLQATNEQLYPFLGQPVGLRVIRCRHVGVDMGELFTLMSANAATLSVVEMSSYELPTLQLFGFLPRVTELELRNATILNQPVVVQAQGSTGPSLPLPANSASSALAHLSVLQCLQKLDLSGLRSSLDLTHLVNCASLRLLNLSSSVVTNEDLVAITKMPSLQDLFLSHTGVDDVSPLSKCASLQMIQLSHTDVTTEGIRTLETLDNLRHLDLSYTKVDDVNFLAASKGLSTLNVWKTHVTSEGLSLLGGLKTLQHLLTGDNDIREVSGLQGCVSLKHLSLQSTLVTSAGMAGLGTLQELEDLNLSNTLVTDVSTLCEAKALRKLDLTGARVTAEGLSNLKRLPLLNSLILSKTDVEHLDELRGCPELREIVGKRCRLTTFEGVGDIPHLSTLVATHCAATSANPLKQCKELTSLNLWGSRITQEGILELGECRTLRDVDLAETMITSIAPLLTCTRVTALVLYSSQLKSIDGIGALRDLTRLDLANTSVLSLAPLMHCTILEVLNISDTNINDEGFQGVEKLPALKTLMLSSTHITRIGQMGQSAELTELHAGKCSITSAGIEGIEGARKLEKLNLSYTEVGAGVTRLAWCCRLQKLNLKFTKVPREDIEYLRNYLPKCRILAY